MGKIKRNTNALKNSFVLLKQREELSKNIKEYC